MSFSDSSPYSNISSESGFGGSDIIVDRCQVCGSNENVQPRTCGTTHCCRACWAFYRRSIVQSRHYVCSRGNNCLIDRDGMRNICRACRLKKCVAVGLRPDFNGEVEELTPISQTNQMPSVQNANAKSITGLIDYSTPIFNFEMPVSLVPSKDLILKRIYKHAFESLLSTQKSVFIADNPTFAINFVDPEPRPITGGKCRRFIEDGTRLIKMIFARPCDVYGEIDFDDNSMHEMSPFIAKFRILSMLFLTTKFGGQIGSENRVFVHFGYYFDLNNLEYFLDGVQLSPERIVQRTLNLRPFVKAISDSATKMRKMGVRDVEMAALCAILFWEQLEKIGLMNNSTLNCKEALYAELHANLIDTYGLVQAGIRLIDLLAFIAEIVVFESNFNEMRMISDIFYEKDGC